MSSTKKFFKSSMVYFMGNVLTKIISFFLLPLYTTRISTDEYGYFNTSTNYLDILIAILCMEIWSVIMRFMFDYEGRRGKEKAITNGLVIFCVSLLGYCAVFAVLALALDLQYLLLIFIMGLCSMIQAIYTYTTRGLGYNAVFAVSGIVGSLVNSLTNVALILGFSMTVKSLYLAAIAGYVVQILMLERKVHLLRAIHPKLVRPRLLKRMLRFSLPLAANAVCACFLTNYNSIMVTNLLGLSEEQNGLIYTRRGGFIDIAHVRDTADNTFYLFNRIAPTLGQAGRIFYSEELGVRRVQLNAFTPPAGVRQRYQLAAWLAGHLAFEIAQWHEIAQWYGFQSVPGFSEEISAFSPEDLYSNLLGARLAINVILSGHGGSLEDYNQAMDAALKQVLTRLLVATRGETEAMFQQIDGDWWNSHRRVPDKFLVLKRNYDLQENRLPTPVPFETMPPYRLTMPEQVGGFRLRDLGELQIYPGHDMQALPVPAQYYGAGAFQGLADRAHEADKTQLARTEK